MEKSKFPSSACSLLQPPTAIAPPPTLTLSKKDKSGCSQLLVGWRSDWVIADPMQKFRHLLTRFRSSVVIPGLIEVMQSRCQSFVAVVQNTEKKQFIDLKVY